MIYSYKAPYLTIVDERQQSSVNDLVHWILMLRIANIDPFLKHWHFHKQKEDAVLGIDRNATERNTSIFH